MQATNQKACMVTSFPSDRGIEQGVAEVVLVCPSRQAYSLPDEVVALWETASRTDKAILTKIAGEAT